MSKTVNKAQELYIRISKETNNFSWDEVNPYLDAMFIGDKGRVLTTPYYKFIYTLCKITKPKQVVELGTHYGMSGCMFLAGMLKDSKFLTVDIESDGRYIPKDDRVTKVSADDLKLLDHLEDFDLSLTDIWFIDTLHDKKHLEKEIKYFSPFWKKGAIVLLDDVDSPDFNLKDYWPKIKYEKFRTKELTDHGFGILVI